MIDWARVTELKDDFGEDGFAELLPVFAAEIDEALDRLGPDMTPSELQSTAHFIKGAAANLGLSELAELCAKIETDAKANVCDPNAANKLRTLFADSQKALNSGR